METLLDLGGAPRPGEQLFLTWYTRHKTHPSTLTPNTATLLPPAPAPANTVNSRQD